MATQQVDLIYISDMAKKLGRTEASIRAGVARAVDWLPPSFAMGRRIAWRAADVDAFLAKKAAKQQKSRKQ